MSSDRRSDPIIDGRDDLGRVVPVDFKAVILRGIVRGRHLNAGERTQATDPK